MLHEIDVKEMVKQKYAEIAKQDKETNMTSCVVRAAAQLKYTIS